MVIYYWEASASMIIKLMFSVVFTDLKAALLSWSVGTHTLLMIMVVNLQVTVFMSSKLVMYLMSLWVMLSLMLQHIQENTSKMLNFQTVLNQ